MLTSTRTDKDVMAFITMNLLFLCLKACIAEIKATPLWISNNSLVIHVDEVDTIVVVKVADL